VYCSCTELQDDMPGKLARVTVKICILLAKHETILEEYQCSDIHTKKTEG